MRVAVTGITSDFGTVIAPLLLEDPEIEDVLGIDLREPRVAHAKLRFEREDVRSPRMRELLDGSDVVIHLAFVVSEIHDKELTHSVNLGGSRNVIESAHAAGARRLVIASSVASYGMHTDNPVPITEDVFPRGNHDKYYFYDKAEVEHFIEWWERHHPDAEMVITRIRPPFIAGPHFDNPALDFFCGRSALMPGEPARFQMLWEDDLARAFHLAAKQDAPGPFNVATDDWMTIEDFAPLHGQRVRRAPRKVAEIAAEALFRLRLAPMSDDWVMSGEAAMANGRAKRELGWEPRFSSAEVAPMLLVQRGRPIMPGRSGEVFARKEIAEEALEPVTERLRAWASTIPGLRATLAGPEELDRMAGRVEHVLLPFKDKRIHLELQTADAEDAPTLVFSHAIGGHARFYLPVLGRLRDEGFNVIGIDRPGHGLSEGRRGDATIEQVLDVIERAVAYARARFRGPVALVGQSLGGIISWYALTRAPDVDAAVCANIAHPQVFHEPAMRVKVPALKRLARVAPRAPVPIRRIANFDVVAQSPELLDFFRSAEDGTWCWALTARSVASFFTYRPPIDWSRVETPALVIVGGADAMVSARFTEEVLRVARPPNAELKVLPGLGHMLFHDHLDVTLPLVSEWLHATLAGKPAAVTG